MEAVRYNSPNFDARDPTVPLKYIVLHYTGTTKGKVALECYADKESKLSAHYMIEKDGRLFQLVDEDKRAWHAGKSFWAGIADLNSASIGIELVNPGHQFGYRPFPAPQIEMLKELLHDIVKRHKLSPREALLAHSDIAPGRKEDPGELFPWRVLAEEGLGVWPLPQQSDYAPVSEAEVQSMLRTIGYNCPQTGDYDRAMRVALLAFQRRFQPDNLTGTPEKETVARLRALLAVKK